MRKSNNRKDRIVCLVGQSGSGKTTIAEAMEKYGYSQIKSYTTRLPRGADETGHTFVNKMEFDQLRSSLVAYTEFDGKEYGTTIQQIKDNDMYVVDPFGVSTLSAMIGRENMLVIHLWAKEQVILNRLIKSRGMRSAMERLNHDTPIYSKFSDYDVLLVNNTIEELKRNEAILRTALADFMQ